MAGNCVQIRTILWENSGMEGAHEPLSLGKRENESKVKLCLYNDIKEVKGNGWPWFGKDEKWCFPLVNPQWLSRRFGVTRGGVPLPAEVSPAVVALAGDPGWTHTNMTELWLTLWGAAESPLNSPRVIPAGLQALREKDHCSGCQCTHQEWVCC